MLLLFACLLLFILRELVCQHTFFGWLTIRASGFLSSNATCECAMAGNLTQGKGIVADRLITQQDQFGRNRMVGLGDGWGIHRTIVTSLECQSAHSSVLNRPGWKPPGPEIVNGSHERFGFVCGEPDSCCICLCWSIPFGSK